MVGAAGDHQSAILSPSEIVCSACISDVGLDRIFTTLPIARN